MDAVLLFSEQITLNITNCISLSIFIKFVRRLLNAMLEHHQSRPITYYKPKLIIFQFGIFLQILLYFNLFYKASLIFSVSAICGLIVR